MGYDTGLKVGEHACTDERCTAEHSTPKQQIEGNTGFYAPIGLLSSRAVGVFGGDIAGKAYVLGVLVLCAAGPMVALRKQPSWIRVLGAAIGVFNPWVYERLVEVCEEVGGPRTPHAPASAGRRTSGANAGRRWLEALGGTTGRRRRTTS